MKTTELLKQLESALNENNIENKINAYIQKSLDEISDLHDIAYFKYNSDRGLYGIQVQLYQNFEKLASNSDNFSDIIEVVKSYNMILSEIDSVARKVRTFRDILE